MPWIDLTLKLASDHPARKRLAEHGQDLLRAGHLGTHLDRHLGSAIPLDYVVSRGVVVDIAHLDEGAVGLADLSGSQIEPGDFLVLHTGRLARLGYGTPEYGKSGVRLSDEVIEDLLQKGIHFIGIDGPGIRQGPEHTPVDKVCEAAGVYVIENLDHVPELLQTLRSSGQPHCTIYTMWWETEGTGLPCRVVARLKEQ